MNAVPNNLIYQCRLANLPEWAIHSAKNIGQYAKKVGAEHEFSRKSTLKGLDESIVMHRYFNILEVIYNKRFDQYDNILYLDTDVIADPNAENIFDINIKKHIDVVGVWEKPLGNGAPGFNQKDQKRLFHEKYSRFNIPIIRKNIHQINTGVIIFTKKGRMKARERFDDWIPWASDPIRKSTLDNDQPFLNAMFDKYEFNVMSLDDTWNMPVSWFNNVACPKANFYHFSGGKHDTLLTTFKGSYMPAGKKFNLNKKSS